MDASRLIISDEERRRVAALLRKEADGWAEDCPDTVTCESYDCYEFILNIADAADIDLSNPPSMLFEHLADLIDRPNCRNVSGDQNRFECSECGFEMPIWDGDGGWMAFYFCPNCGAEVVADDD